MSVLSGYNDFFSKPRIKQVELDVYTSPPISILANSYLVQESITLEESLYSDENIRFGACESSCLTLRISRELNIDFKDEWIEVSFSCEGDAGILIDADGNAIVDSDGDTIVYQDGSSTTDVTLGRFKVVSVKPTKDRMYQDLTCYDKMYDIINANVVDWYNNLTFPMSLKNFRDSFFTELGVTQVTATLVNDNFMIQGGFAVEDEISGKTIIEAICELNGVFGHITKDNKFEYISIPGSETVPLAYYQNGTCVYEDYVTDAFTGVIAYSEDGNVGDSVGTDTNPYLIQNNYLLWGSEGTQDIEDALTNLLTKISSVRFRPFTVRTYGNPMLPLGTPITMTSQNGSISSVVMRKYMSGIQNLRDELSAVGDKHYPNDINSTKKEIMRSKGTRTMVEKVNGRVCVKIDSNGNLGLAEVGADPDEGLTYVTISAQNINIESDTVSFDNDGYEVRGPVYKSKITPTSHEIQNQIINRTAFPVLPDDEDAIAKAISNDLHYFYWEDRNGKHIQTFNLQVANSTNVDMESDESSGTFWHQQVVTGKHFCMFESEYNAFIAQGGSIDEDGFIVPPSGIGLLNFVTAYYVMTSYVSKTVFTTMQNAEEPIVAYMKNEDFAKFKPYPLEAMEHMQGNGVPVVIKPYLSIDSYGDIYKGDSYWPGGSDQSLYGALSTINNKIPNGTMRSGTVVKTLTASNPQKIFTATDLSSIFGANAGTISAYLSNGDHAAQSADIIATYIQSGEVYARFSSTPSAGAYRVNYIMCRY